MEVSDYPDHWMVFGRDQQTQVVVNQLFLSQQRVNVVRRFQVENYETDPFLDHRKWK